MATVENLFPIGGAPRRLALANDRDFAALAPGRRVVHMPTGAAATIVAMDRVASPVRLLLDFDGDAEHRVGTQVDCTIDAVVPLATRLPKLADVPWLAHAVAETFARRSGDAAAIDGPLNGMHTYAEAGRRLLRDLDDREVQAVEAPCLKTWYIGQALAACAFVCEPYGLLCGIHLRRDGAESVPYHRRDADVVVPPVTITWKIDVPGRLAELVVEAVTDFGRDVGRSEIIAWVCVRYRERYGVDAGVEDDMVALAIVQATRSGRIEEYLEPMPGRRMGSDEMTARYTLPRARVAYPGARR